MSNETTCNIKLNSDAAKLIQLSKLFVWDEAPMLDKHVYETVDRTFRDIMKQVDTALENLPFGGKVFVFGGDFRQILPVIKRGNRESIVSSCLKRSYLWDKMKTLKLSVNMRLHQHNNFEIQEQKQFSDYLLKIGEGKEKIIKELGEHVIQLPNDICMPLTTISDLITEIYDDFENNYKSPSYLINRSILATTNKVVDSANQYILNLIPSEEHTYYSADSTLTNEDAAVYPTEFLNTLNVSGLPPHKLCLKQHAIVICIRNLNVQNGLCNGTRLIIHNFGKHVIECEIISGNHIGERIFLPRITLIPNEQEIPFEFKRKQFPIKLAFALTINKAQGQTIKRLGLYAEEPLFHHGQLYTTMSRVTNKKNLKIMLKQTEHNNKKGYFINNVVYNEVFRF